MTRNATVVVVRRDLDGSILQEIPVTSFDSVNIVVGGNVLIGSGNDVTSVDPGDIHRVEATASSTDVELPVVTVTQFDLAGEVASEWTVDVYGEVWATPQAVKIRANGRTRTIPDAAITNVQ